MSKRFSAGGFHTAKRGVKAALVAMGVVFVLVSASCGGRDGGSGDGGRTVESSRPSIIDTPSGEPVIPETSPPPPVTVPGPRYTEPEPEPEPGARPAPVPDMEPAPVPDTSPLPCPT